MEDSAEIDRKSEIMWRVQFTRYYSPITPKAPKIQMCTVGKPPSGAHDSEQTNTEDDHWIQCQL